MINIMKVSTIKVCEKTFKLDLKDASYNNKEMYTRKGL